MKTRITLLFLLVVAQVAWLSVQYQARQRELETAPRLLVACEFFDPRDPLRGDYVQFECPLRFSSGDPKVSPGVWECWDGDDEDTFVGYWKPEDEGPGWQISRVCLACAAEDQPQEGEIRTILCMEGISRYDQDKDTLKLFLSNKQRNGWWSRSFRYYVSEKTGDVQSAWKKGYKDQPYPDKRIRLTASILVRGEGELLPAQLYLNGIPWQEAIQQIRNGSFPLLSEPASADEEPHSLPEVALPEGSSVDEAA